MEGFFSKALWRNTFVADDELRISILEERKKTRSIKMRRKSLLTLPTSADAIIHTDSSELKKAPIKVHH